MNTDTNLNETWKLVPNISELKVSSKGNLLKIKNGIWQSPSYTYDKTGYKRISYKGRTYTYHQLVAMAFLGHEPNGMKNVIDHLDGNVLNNSVENLRVVSIRENANNRHHKKSSKYVGVNWHKRSKKWQSKIKYKGKQYTLGMFNDEEKASIAYQAAKKVLEQV